MKIGGLQRVSLNDYPGKICATVFTQGCNFRCPYCHNPELVDPGRYGPVLPEEDVLSFLDKRRGKLEAVTVTGGEPTLQKDLEKFLGELKNMGYLVKVDTNGSNPDTLSTLDRPETRRLYRHGHQRAAQEVRADCCRKSGCVPNPEKHSTHYDLRDRA